MCPFSFSEKHNSLSAREACQIPFFPKTQHDFLPVCFAVVDLVYWRSMRRTGVVFTGLVIGLASIFQLSAITVLSHVCLGIMCITFPLRLYYKLLELLRWNPGIHPFQ